MPANKRGRHTAIREILSSTEVSSQDELRRLLAERGWDVTQSTLSRDLREMGVGRIPTPAGPRYTSPDGGGSAASPRTIVADVLPQFFSSLDGVNELLVLKTAYGGAQPVAESIDDAGWPEVIGTIGGENTILVICRSAAAREKVERRILRLAEG